MCCMQLLAQYASQVLRKESQFCTFVTGKWILHITIHEVARRGIVSSSLARGVRKKRIVLPERGILSGVWLPLTECAELPNAETASKTVFRDLTMHS